MCGNYCLRDAVSAFIFVLSLGCGCSAHADDYPSKPIRIIVPFTAGGAIDIVARTVTQKVGENLGVPTVIENRAGAGGNVGAIFAAKFPPDGYGIFVCNITNAVYPSLYRKRAYDPLKDFIPITHAASFAYVLAVHPLLPAKSVSELVALARRRPGQIVYGSSGVGSPPHFAGEMMSLMTNIKMTHVPYGGNPQAQQDLIGGHIQVLFINTANALPFMKAGRVRGLALSSPRRSELIPELPTLVEIGLPGFDINSWAGFCAPDKTPSAVIQKLDAEFMKSLETAEIRQKLLAQGFEVNALPSARFRQYLEVEVAKYAQLVKQAGIEPQ